MGRVRVLTSRKIEPFGCEHCFLGWTVGESGTEHDTTHTGIKKTDNVVNVSKEEIANNEKISDHKK
jgi:hypothetical protein